MNRPSQLQRITTVAVVAIAYCLSARLGLSLATQPEQVTAIWPPAGVAIAALVLYGTWVWPGIALGAFVANAFAHEPLYVAAGIAVGNTLEGLAGAWFLRRNFKPQLCRLSDVTRLMVVAPFSTLIAATLGTAILTFGGLAARGDAPYVWYLWWLGDSMGIYVVAPLLLTWLSAQEEPPSYPTGEIIAFLLVFAALVLFCFSLPFEYALQIKFIIFPVLVWAAYRFGQRITSAAIVLTSVIAILMLLHNPGGIHAANRNALLLVLQGFVAVLAMTSLILAALASERRSARLALQASHDQLETHVRAKTVALEDEIGARKLAEQNLQAAYGQLEQRVEERTRELSQATEAMRRGEQRLQAIIDNSTAIIHMKDTAGNYLLVNREWEVANKLDRKNVIGRPARDFYPAGAVDALMRNDQRVLESKAPIQVEETVPHPGGTRTYLTNKFPLLDGAGNCYAICGISTDITRRKEEERAVQESDARKSAVFDSALDCIIGLDSRGCVTEWNPAAEKTFQYTRAEAVGAEMAVLIVPASLREQHRRGLDRYCRTGESHILNRRIELTAMRKDGTEFPVEVTITRVAFGTEPVFMGYLRDITERKRIQELEHRAKEQAEAANRAKDEFLAVVSHELRTPLTAILGWTRLLRMNPDDAAQTAHALQVIERNVRTQVRLVEDLLDISRIITGKLRLRMQPVNLAVCVQAAIDTVAAAAKAKNVTLRQVSSFAGTITGDADRVQQVVWNILTNAIKFTPSGGWVNLELRKNGKTAELVISDSGQGIAPEYLPQMFTRFSQADSSTTRHHGGLGLGLAIVKHIVDLHGGSVSAESKGKDQGARFTVTFPLAEDHVQADASKAVPRSGLLARNLEGVTVLAIDDEPDTLEYVSAVLEFRGARVLSVSNPGEAIARIQAARPDVVISDIAMPGLDGFGLIEQLRAMPSEQGGQTPAIALTAYARQEDRTQLLHAGFQMHLTKPIDPLEIVSAVTSVLGRS